MRPLGGASCPDRFLPSRCWPWPQPDIPPSRPRAPSRAGATRTGRPATTRSSRAGPNRCPTRGIRTTAGRGDRSAASTPRTPTASGSRCAASCRCRKGAKPWTPYAALNPSRGNATGNGDGISATCEPEREARMGAALRALDLHPEPARAIWWTSGRISTSCSRSCPAAAARTRSRSARTTRRSTSGSSTTSCT